MVCLVSVCVRFCPVLFCSLCVSFDLSSLLFVVSSCCEATMRVQVKSSVLFVLGVVSISSVVFRNLEVSSTMQI